MPYLATLLKNKIIDDCELIIFDNLKYMTIYFCLATRRTEHGLESHAWELKTIFKYDILTKLYFSKTLIFTEESLENLTNMMDLEL